MEINKDPRHEEKQAVYSGSVVAREAVTVSWLWQRLRSRQRTGELRRGEREGSQGAVTGGCWLEETGDRLSRTGVTYAVGLGCVYGFLCWSQVGNKMKNHRSCQLLIKCWPLGVDSYVS